MAKVKFITEQEALTLKQAGHVVHIYPHKRLVVVDGYKYYTLTEKEG